MKDEEINKIAEAIAAKLAEPGGKNLLGCGSASSTSHYDCNNHHSCYGRYECGGNGNFSCTGAGTGQEFYCWSDFACYSNFLCRDGLNFFCEGQYNT